MLQYHFQLSAYPDALGATGSSMPWMQYVQALTSKGLGENADSNGLKEKDQHKRPWCLLNGHS